MGSGPPDWACWITETPGVGGRFAPLMDFGSAKLELEHTLVRTTNGASVGGTTASPGSFPHAPGVLLDDDSSGNKITPPSPPNSEQTSFPVGGAVWATSGTDRPVARRGSVPGELGPGE
jgi:hypothetical protein